MEFYLHLVPNWEFMGRKETKNHATSNNKFVQCSIYISYSANYGFHGTRNFSFLAFFQFLVSRREIGDEKREIDFLHFLPNFGQILVLFEDFSKHNQHFRGFWGHFSWKLGSKKWNSLPRALIWYIEIFNGSFISWDTVLQSGKFFSFFSRFSREMA